MNRLDGKVALISGAARGIGGETARLMAEAGAMVAIGDVLDERGRETARALGDAALYVHLDVTREDDWNAAVAAAVGRFGKLDILVNNAGLFLGKDIEAASLAEWERLCAGRASNEQEASWRSSGGTRFRALALPPPAGDSALQFTLLVASGMIGNQRLEHSTEPRGRSFGSDT